MTTVECLIALGSNLGDRAAHLNRACELINGSNTVTHFAASRFFGTPPIGGPPGQSEFLNAAAFLRTELSAGELFMLLKKIEQQVGRQHVERWGPRVIDLDLLLHGETVLTGDSQRSSQSDLIVPHPRMAFRRFVLEPAAEVAPQMRHPVIGWTIRQLLEHLETCPPHVAIFSGDAKRARQLASDIAVAAGTCLLSAGQIDALGISAWGADEILRDGAAEEKSPPRPKLSIVDGCSPTEATGPSLDITNLSPEVAVAEVVAAIEAMRE